MKELERPEIERERDARARNLSATAAIDVVGFLQTDGGKWLNRMLTSWSEGVVMEMADPDIDEVRWRQLQGKYEQLRSLRSLFEKARRTMKAAVDKKRQEEQNEKTT